MVLAADFHQLTLLFFLTNDSRAGVSALAQRTACVLRQDEAVLAAHPAGQVQTLLGLPQRVAILGGVASTAGLGYFGPETVHTPAVGLVALCGQIVAIGVAGRSRQSDVHVFSGAFHTFSKFVEIFTHLKENIAMDYWNLLV